MSNTDKREWRTLQIAVSEIKRYNQDADIDASNNRYYDLLVSQPRKGVKYGVEIVRSEFSRTKGFTQYKELLNQFSGEIDVPILLLSVNEVTEEVKIGILFTWFHERPLITRDLVPRKSTQDSWNHILFVLSMSSQIESPIQFLQSDHFYIKKTISLEAVRNQGRLFFAELVYLRKLSESYRMNSRERSTQQELSDFYINGYNPEEYPNDSLDNAIYQAVREKFDVQPAANQLILINTELRDLQIYREYHRGHCHFSLTPRLDDVDGIVNRLLGAFNALLFDVELYALSENDKNFFDGYDFSHQDNVDGWVDKLIEYKNSLQNLRPLSEVIG